MHSHEIKNYPRPDQLFRLAAIGICLAKEQGKLKESRFTERAHIFLSRDIETIEVHSNEDYKCSRHKFIGRIGRIGYKHWSMRIAEPYWVSAEDGDDGYRATYRFEWTNKNVFLAKKNMKAKHEGEEEIPIAELALDQLSPDFLHAVNEFQTVSEADCNQLISEMDRFSRTPNFGALQYNR